MKIVTIVGARPQFIKAAILSRVLRAVAGISECLIHTGQHYDPQLSDVFFRDLEIPKPDYYLGIGSGHHGRQTAQMLQAIEEVLLAEQADGVIVFGDTNSTLAGALATAKLNIPLAHVEAGLRCFNRSVPEEINRVLTDHSAALLFAPTVTAVENLRREGILQGVHLVGDVMCDALLRHGSLAETKSKIQKRLGLTPGNYVLATIHRAENTDSPHRLKVILDAFARVAQKLPVILPLHPRTRNAASRFGIPLTASGLQVIDPLGYLDMIMLERHARVIATDSGGVQKEAYIQGVPCVTVRGETEWTELVTSGWNRLAMPTDVDTVIAGVEAALASAPDPQDHIYGDGHSAEQITRILLERWQDGSRSRRELVGSRPVVTDMADISVATRTFPD